MLARVCKFESCPGHKKKAVKSGFFIFDFRFSIFDFFLKIANRKSHIAHRNSQIAHRKSKIANRKSFNYRIVYRLQYVASNGEIRQLAVVARRIYPVAQKDIRYLIVRVNPDEGPGKPGVAEAVR